MWELDHKEGWVPKNWCFETLMLEKTLENPLDCKETKPVNSKGNKSLTFFGRTDAEAKDPILDHLMWRAGSLVKSLVLGKMEGRRRRVWERMRWLDDITNSMGKKAKSLSHVRLFVTPWTVAYQAPLSGIFQARVLEWVAVFFSRGSSQPGIVWTWVSHIAGRLFAIRANTEAHRLNAHELKLAPGDGEGQGSLVCCSAWVSKSWTQLSKWTATTKV